MHLFETDEGDKWVCIWCGKEKYDEIIENKWEHIFDKEDPTLRCFFCNKGDYNFDED